MSRAVRNNLSSGASIERRRRAELCALRTERYLVENNEFLKMELKIAEDAGCGTLPVPSQPVPPSTSSFTKLRTDLALLLGKTHMAPEAVVDLYDRVATGNEGKGPPKDPDALRCWLAAQSAAAVRAPSESQVFP